MQLSSKTIELAEYKTYYLVKNRVCYYDYPNGNGVLLPYDDTSLEKASTLVDMPVQAKYTVNSDGLPDLSDHCVTVDENGNYQFNTVSVGTHTGVEIYEDTVETADGKTMVLPCLFATAKIWRRYPNYCTAIKRLFDENNLHNSWEITSFSYAYKDGIKTLGDYVFEGNAYLGGDVMPAYGETSKILELSQNKNAELLVASALSEDLITSGKDNSSGEEEQMLTAKTASATAPAVDPIVASAEPVSATSATVVEPVVQPEPTEPVSELASMTASDLAEKIRKKCRAKLDCWCYMAFWFPSESSVWVKSENDNGELDYQLFTYTVVDDDVEVSDPIPVKLSVSVKDINTVLSEKTDGLIAANTKIEDLNTQLSAMSKYKEAYDTAESERANAEREAKIVKMRTDAADSKCFSQEELESEDMEALFTSCDENALKLKIADKFMEKLRSENTIETAAITPPTSVKSELTYDDTVVDPVKIVRDFLR